jgi:hypothetical protein
MAGRTQMHHRCYPTHRLLYAAHVREAEEAPRAKAPTTAPRRAEAHLGAARRAPRGRRGRAARLQPQAGSRSPRRQYLNNRPSPRSVREHGEDALGSAADPRRRTRALPRRASRAAPRTWRARRARPAVLAAAARRRGDPARVRSRARIRRHRPSAQRGRRSDRARWPAVVAVDGARRSRPLKPGAFRRAQRPSSLSVAASLDRRRGRQRTRGDDDVLASPSSHPRSEPAKRAPIVRISQ